MVEEKSKYEITYSNQNGEISFLTENAVDWHNAVEMYKVDTAGNNYKIIKAQRSKEGLKFPDFHDFMKHMPLGHDKSPCFGAFNLCEQIEYHGEQALNKELDGYARKWETSPRKILDHMSCVYAFLDKERSAYNPIYFSELGIPLSPEESKELEIEEKMKEEENSYDENDDYDDGRDSRNEKYAGYNGYSDDAIDSAFDGDPEATWNVD